MYIRSTEHLRVLCTDKKDAGAFIRGFQVIALWLTNK